MVFAFSATTAGPGGPNLHIYKSDNGDLVKDFIHKKQTGWYVATLLLYTLFFPIPAKYSFL